MTLYHTGDREIVYPDIHHGRKNAGKGPESRAGCLSESIRAGVAEGNGTMRPLRFQFKKERQVYCSFLMISMMVVFMFFLFGCGKTGQVMDGDDMEDKSAYARISQDQAKLMMQDDDGHVIVDVRRADEYAKGHIPGAILIPNEEIGSEEPQELPDKNQVILVYCRTGRRSREAAQKLADMGYVNVYEFGGIMDWSGDIVTDDTGSNIGGKSSSLSFESFDGGGPKFNVVVDDESIVSYSSKAKYRDPDHEEMDGAGYDVIITFTGTKPGETSVVIEERSPIADNLDHKYKVTVDDELNVQIEQLSVKDISEE